MKGALDNKLAKTTNSEEMPSSNTIDAPQATWEHQG
jgi:hypothetical protein